MNKILIFGVIILMVIPTFANKLGVLKDIAKPDVMRVQDNELFIVEGEAVLVYSLENMMLKTKFGKAGEGPGEFKKVPNFSNNIFVSHRNILVESVDKISYFSRDGKLVKEQKKFPGTVKVMPVGDNFAGTSFTQGEGGKMAAVISIYNSKLEKKKELFRQRFPQQGMSEADLIPDSLNFWVCGDKLYVEESPKGFFIEIFDQDGKKLGQIEKKYNKKKVTTDDCKAAENKLKDEPIIKMQGWENVKKVLQFKFPNSFPAIKDIFADGKKLYIQTYNMKGDKTEMLVMDPDGKNLQNVYLPLGQPTRLLVEFLGLGPRYYSIDNGKLYYLIENDENENWELHKVDIK